MGRHITEPAGTLARRQPLVTDVARQLLEVANYDPVSRTGEGRMETWRVLAGAAMCLALIFVGVALATNFRGVTEWHVRVSMSTASVLRRVPPWRWLPEVPHDERLARFILLERVMGVAFAVVGLMVLMTVGYSALIGQPMRMTK
jgi:hypothetical protein